MKRFEYTYEVKSVDPLSAHAIVKYTPTDPKLLAIEYNIALFEQNEDGSVRTLQECVELAAPHHVWGAQENVIAAGNSFVNSTGTVTPDQNG